LAFKTMAWDKDRRLGSSVCTSSWRSIRCIARNQGRRSAVIQRSHRCASSSKFKTLSKLKPARTAPTIHINHKERSSLHDVRYREAMYRVIGRWLKGVHAVSTGITVTALARPEWLIEIDVIAVKS
jgi:hypothetical protein